MAFTAKPKNNSSSSSSTEGWGMGFFLVFFPEEQEDPNNNNTINRISKKKTIFSSPSSSLPSPFNTLLRRTNSAQLLSKAQSTISICALLVFFSLLLFTLSTFEPTTTPRRQLSSIKIYRPNSNSNSFPQRSSLSHALQGMGTLYTRGTKAMNDLIICHVMESVTVKELGLFLRLLHRSSLTSRSDLLFIFPSSSVSFDSTVRQENESFLKLITQFKELNGSVNSAAAASFDVTQFVRSSKKEKEKEKENEEPIWGRRTRSNNGGEEETELTRLSYGSVVGFEVDELDPENSLAGFLDHVPMSLRRWACYPMLLGRLRRNFKHLTLVDAKDMLLLGDPLGRVKSRSPESVYLSTFTTPTKHSRKKSDKTQSQHQKPVNPSIITGGARGIRRLSNAMVTEIVRAAMQHKRKNSVSESGILNQLAGNDFVLKNVKLVVSTESTPDLSSLNSAASLSLSNHTVVRRGNSNIDFYATFMKHICSFPLDSSVYSDC